MALRFGRGRRPDPTREGTVYRAEPGFRLSRSGSANTRATGAASALATGVSQEEFWAAQRENPSAATPSEHSKRVWTAPKPKKRHRGRWIVGVLLVLLVAYPLALGVVAWTSLHQIEAFPTGARPADTAGENFLVVGSDSRADLSRNERARLGTGQSTGVLTDTIMLLHRGSGRTVLVSIPRDSYVAIPGHGKNKINAAFSMGGAPLLVKTVEQATGLRIDHFVMTGLGQFADVVDAIGGVQVCPKKALNDTKAHINIPAGCQTLDGKTALGYSRARYSDPAGDLGRVRRQREVLAAIANKVLSPAVLAEPWRAFPAAKAGGNALTVNNGTYPWTIAQFVLGMKAVTGSSGASITVPIGANINTAAGASLAWDQAKAQALFTAIAQDDSAALTSIAAHQAKG